MFTENHHLLEFSPIMKFLFQHTKGADFYTHYFIGVLAYVVISRHFILKSIVWRLSSWKIIILHQMQLICVLNNFLISCIQLKLLFRMCLKEMLESKAFSLSTIGYLRCYFQDLSTSISVVAAMLPIMVRPNTTLKSEFVNIRHFTSHWEKSKIHDNKLTAIQEHLLCCNYSPSYEDFSILTRESNGFKLKIMESLLIACDKPCLNKADFSLPLELFWYNISGYHMMFYNIVWHPSITMCVYNCGLFSFQYYVAISVFYQKQNLWAFNKILGMTMKAVAFKS